MAQTDKIPYRQIHLDYHTSKYIEGIADQFNVKEFVETLKAAHVNSINLFTKCHHGMFYYPTKIGTVHPHLKIDLFGEQIKACKENNIRAVAYTCVAWNEDWADRHPEWLVIDHNGVIGNKDPFANTYTTWRSMCINNPEYKELLKQEFREVYDSYKPQGFWVDIILGRTCICRHCSNEMKHLGLDPQKLADVKRHDALVEIAFCKEFFEFFKSMDTNLEIYFNSVPYQLDNGMEEELSSVEKRKYFSFIDIESLPSEEWGYSHFPVAVNYINKFDTEYAMMNGKFHSSWGDFGSLRNKEAMEYEAFRAIAHGAKICVGDQLHPSGKLDKVVYQRIGEVFKSVEQKEPWLKGTSKVSEVAVIIPTGCLEIRAEKGSIIEESCYRILSELHIPFDFINFKEDLGKYQLVILPDNVRLNGAMALKLNTYTKNGGKLLVTGKSGLSTTKDEFVLNDLGCSYSGESPYDVRYVRLKDECFTHLPQIDHALYLKGEQIKLTDGKPLASIVNPYFNRSYDHFCSHRQTPPMLEESGDTAIVENKHCIYIASPLFSDYGKNGVRIYKDILEACIKRLYKNMVVITDLPSITEVTLRENSNSLIVHLVNYVIQKKCKLLDTIEEKFLVKDRYIKVRTGFKPSSVRFVPEKIDLPFEYADNYVTIPIAYAEGHTMIEIIR